MPTFVELRADVLREADLVDGQIDDSDVGIRLNEELAGLYELIVGAFEGWASAETTLTVTAGQDYVSLPADFFRVTDVADIRDPTHPISLDTFDFKDRNRLVGCRGMRRFCIHGSRLIIRPTASAPGAYLLTYTPSFAPLVADGDSFDAPNLIHTYAVLGAAIRLRNDQELSASGLEDRRKDVGARIAAQSQHRKGPHKARDVRRALHREDF